LGQRRGGSIRRVKYGERRTDGDGLSRRHENARKYAGHRCGNFGSSLVGFDFEQHVFRLHRIAFPLAPSDDRTFGDCFAELRHQDVHVRS
jgi:hypothetical protein